MSNTRWSFIEGTLREVKNRIFDVLFLVTGARCFLGNNISRRYYTKIKHYFFKSPFFVARLDDAQLSFSQEGEDLILKRIIGNKIDKGYYLDIGAHHPTRFSNTYSFYLQGWNGINIEPNPEVISAFSKIRGRDINLNFAVGSKEGVFEYFMMNDPALNTFSSERVNDALKNRNYFLKKKIHVLMRPLADILDEYWDYNNEFTFLSVDCEYYDYEVIASNNWIKYRPIFVLVECVDHALGKESNEEKDVCHFMESVKYVRIANTLNTVFFLDSHRKYLFE